jgi:RHH-type transcriptional regulator, proline utilization regulon repressor / proline dehydrogenase / delta 1-pyrroline-5-carboxylate dehydrogenase
MAIAADSFTSAAGNGDDIDAVDHVVEVARRLVAVSSAAADKAPRRQAARQRRLAGLVRSASAKDFTMALTDEVVRIESPKRAARRVSQLVNEGSLDGFSSIDRLLLRVAGRVAPLFPSIVMSNVRRRLRSESDGVIVSAEDAAFAAFVTDQRTRGARINVNVLGEAILGRDEAQRRCAAVQARLARPDVDYVSVKLSAICATVSSLAFDATVDAVAVSLRELYREAQRSTPNKFVNLDMEEYRDLELTIAVFQKVLSEPEFVGLRAGIVLQAYLPDSHSAAHQLCQWALQRRANGGAGIKIRLVKGANLAMERVDAELHGWSSAPYGTKAEVDASYKKLLDALLDPAYDDAVTVGLASHNLFDVAWGLHLREELERRSMAPRLEMEMLAGMAIEQANAVLAAAGSLLLYTPVVAQQDFSSAVAYLVRRLDENTSPDNFLTSIFDITADNDVFEQQAQRFRAAVRARNDVSVEPRRQQNRWDDAASQRAADVVGGFANEPDTDFSLANNRDWINSHLAKWLPPQQPLSPVVGGQLVVDSATVQVPLILSPLGHYDVRLADVDLVDMAVAHAKTASEQWSATAVAHRAALINGVADVIASQRGEIIATMAHDAGKTVSEGDPEVSEAVDFARYYARSALALDDTVDPALRSALGVVVIAPPWNFPYAIVMGGVLAALAAGNTVIVKPAPQTMLTAWLVTSHCWAAGIGKDVLQFLPCPDNHVGQHLITHDDVDAVVLTGGFDTAQMFHQWKPSLRLHGESSGKNAMIISASADIDNAVKDVVRSAFGHAGQKCSATSLAIVEAELYDDPSFLERLRDATQTLRCGPGWDVTTDVGPLIDPPAPHLLRALTKLDPGESWLVQPKQLSDDGRLWSPGIRLGVRADSWIAATECFGPVLAVMRADDLDDAIAKQNQSRFGLTGGLHALDPHDIEHWTNTVEVGNAYVNRGTTGAIVQRQPFGGWKRSVVGPTFKAGGPLMVASMCKWLDDEQQSLASIEQAYASWWTQHRDRADDPSGLASESNVYRWRTLSDSIGVVFGANATERQRALVHMAQRVLGISIVELDGTDGNAIARWLSSQPTRVRVVGDLDEDVRRQIHAQGVQLDPTPPTSIATIELPRWLREQSISTTQHRHGHVRREGHGAPAIA